MNPYPSMTFTGWITDPETAIEAILGDYCSAEFSATKLYRKMIRSLPYRAMVYGDPMALAAIVQEDLMVLYKNHFDGVQCDVTYNPDEQGDLGSESPRFRLEISLLINDGNQRYSLAKVLSLNNGTILTIGGSTL